MLNKYIQFTPAYDTLFKLIISLLLTCGIGPLTVNVEMEVPITLQTLFLLLSSIAFGWQVGGLNALLYTLLGMAELPVFSGYVGGPENVLGLSGGFFFGFIAASLITGYLAEIPALQKPWFHILIWIFGHIVILVMGGIWLKKFLPPEIFEENIKNTIPGLFVKSAFGFLILQLAIRFFAGRPTLAIKK